MHQNSQLFWTHFQDPRFCGFLRTMCMDCGLNRLPFFISNHLGSKKTRGPGTNMRPSCHSWGLTIILGRPTNKLIPTQAAVG